MQVLVYLVMIGVLGGSGLGGSLGNGMGDDGVDDGRRGNQLYEQGDYAAAESAYREALASVSDSMGTTYTYAALQHNLGAALYRQGDFRDAQAAFTRAYETAPTDRERGRALYNAGNAAAKDEAMETALDFYRRALLLNPDDQRARHNFEFLKREMQRQQTQQGTPPPSVEPSAFAKRLKRQAEALVAEQKYEDAVTLMENGMRRDSTVRAYRGFIQRLKDVSTIDAMP